MHSPLHFELVTTIASDRRRQAATGGWSPVAPGLRVAVESVRLCGELVVEFDGRRVERELPARQGRLLFGYLVLRRSSPVRRDELVDVLWPREAPRDPDAALNSVLARLRRVVGRERLPARGAVRLCLADAAWIDVEVVEAAPRLAREALAVGRAREAFDAVAEALAIIEKPLLAEFERDWIDERRRRLTDLRAPLIETAVDAALTMGGAELERAELAARRGVELEPFRESVHRALMSVLAARGDRAEALRVFDGLRVRLREELGASPSAGLLALHRRLLGEESPVMTDAAANRLEHDRQGSTTATVPRAEHTGGLPLPADAFIGRREELARVEQVVSAQKHDETPDARAPTTAESQGDTRARVHDGSLAQLAPSSASGSSRASATPATCSCIASARPPGSRSMRCCAPARDRNASSSNTMTFCEPRRR